jgi:outer membrane protein assembly factor BamB
VLWKTDLPQGKSSPVLAGDRIFLTGAEGEDLLTICLDRLTGKEQWRRAIHAPRTETHHPLNHRAAPTATTDGENRVFVFFADFGLAAYDFDGNELWRLPLGPFNSQHGIVASPVYADGRVVFVADQDTDAYIIGVDAANGEIAWKTPRHVINGYSTPIVYRPKDGPAQIIAPGSYQLTSYSASDGKPVWFVRGLTCQPKSLPTVADGVVYFNGWTSGADEGEQVDIPAFEEVVAQADANGDNRLAQSELPKPWQPTGTWRAIDLDRDGFMNEREWTFYRTRRASRNGLLAVKLGGHGDVTDSHLLWRHAKSLPDVPSPLIYEGVVFLVRDGGIVTTLDAPTGKVLKQGRLTGAIEGYYASPVGVDGKVYFSSQQGKVTVVRAAGQWEILAVNDFGAEIYATPAMTDGRMYIRTANALYAIGM